MRNAKPYHSKSYHSCHSDTLRHSELRSSEESHSIRHSDTIRHSEGCKPEESHLLCHSEALAEESTLLCHSERSEESKNVESQDTESRCFAIAQHDAHSFRHSEALAEESKIRDSIKDVSASPQHDKKQSKITLTHNQISINAKAFVYMVSNQTNTTLYIGVTSNLIKRMYEHKNKLTQGFTQKYNCNKLVYFESVETIQEAIQREKYLKGKKRDFKESLIDSINPNRLDLYNEILYPSNRDVSASPQHDKGNAQHDRIRHSELRSSEESHSIRHSEDFPPCHSEGCKPEESHLLCHSEDLAEESHPACHSERSEESKNVETQDKESRCFAFAQHDNPCHSDLERSEREESQNTESKKESESTKDKYDFQR